jgi:sugar phosphate isomerase/epimerase
VARRPISLAAGVLPEFRPLGMAEAAVDAGFDYAGLWVETDSWTPAVTRSVRTALGGLPVLDVEFIRIAAGDLGDGPRRLIEIGAELGAAHVLMISSDPDLDATADKVARLAGYAAEHGLRACLEFGVFTAVKSLGAALEVLARADDEAGLLLDPIHVDRSGAAMADLAAAPANLITYAQFCDAPAERPDPADMPAVIADALDLRRLPGEGALDLSGFLSAIPNVPLSIELRSKALREAAPDARQRARIVADATRAWLAHNTALEGAG